MKTCQCNKNVFTFDFNPVIICQKGVTGSFAPVGPYPSLNYSPSTRAASAAAASCVLVGHITSRRRRRRTDEEVSGGGDGGGRIHLGGWKREGGREGRKRSIGSGTPLAATAHGVHVVESDLFEI